MKVSRGNVRVKGLSDPEMDFQLIRAMGVACFGGSSAGECLYLASRIKNGDPLSWVKEFNALGEKVEIDGDKRLEKGHRVSGREQLLKACTYYRAAEYYTDPRDSSVKKYGMKSRECFIKALNFMEHHSEVIEIPFEGRFMPAYFLSPDKSGEKRKTIMIMSGFDGTAEEAYFQGGKAAIERGYNVLLFEGPGQTGLRRFFPELTFRPDYENPIRTVVDHVLTHPSVDPMRLALYGISLGGYYAARGAACDPRIRALIANSPIIDVHSYMTGIFDVNALPGDISLEDLDLIPDIPLHRKISAVNIFIRYGRSSFKRAWDFFKEFNVRDSLSNICCPSLAMVGEGEGEEAVAQAQEFCNGITGPVSLYVFSAQEGADGHCQVSNLSFSCAVLFDWLDEVFA